MCNVATGDPASLLTPGNMCKAAKAVEGTECQIKSQLDCFNLLIVCTGVGIMLQAIAILHYQTKRSHTAILVVADKLTKMLCTCQACINGLLT